MILRVIRPDGDLQREVWDFEMYVTTLVPDIFIFFISCYSFQTRETARHRIWQNQTHWERSDPRNNNIKDVPLPSDVEAEMRERFQQEIAKTPIMR